MKDDFLDVAIDFAIFVAGAVLLLLMAKELYDILEIMTEELIR